MRLRNVPEAKSIVENSPYVIGNPYERRGRWKTFSDKPLYVEIGMGKGRFIIETAKRNPQYEFIGVEIYESVLYKACEKMAGKPDRNPASLAIEAEEKLRKQPDENSPEERFLSDPAEAEEKLRKQSDDKSPEEGRILSDPAEADGEERKHETAPADQTEEYAGFSPPDNLHFLRVDARKLPDIFAAGEVDGIYLNFSDPWPKARHAKRRLTSRRFLATYEQYLKDGGILEFKTDNRALFDFSVEEFREAEKWELINLTYDLHNDPVMSEGNVMTEYEKKFSALGNRINKLAAVYHAAKNTDGIQE